MDGAVALRKGGGRGSRTPAGRPPHRPCSRKLPEPGAVCGVAGAEAEEGARRGSSAAPVVGCGGLGLPLCTAPSVQTCTRGSGSCRRALAQTARAGADARVRTLLGGPCRRARAHTARVGADAFVRMRLGLRADARVRTRLALVQTGACAHGSRWCRRARAHAARARAGADVRVRTWLGLVQTRACAHGSG